MMTTFSFSSNKLGDSENALFDIDLFVVDEDQIDFARKYEDEVLEILIRFKKGDFGLALPDLIRKNHHYIKLNKEQVQAYYQINGEMIFLEKDFKSAHTRMLIKEGALDYYRYCVIMSDSPIDKKNTADKRFFTLGRRFSFSPRMHYFLRVQKTKDRDRKRTERSDYLIDKLLFKYIHGDFGSVNDSLQQLNALTLASRKVTSFVIGEYDFFDEKKVIFFTFPSGEKTLMLLADEFKPFYAKLTKLAGKQQQCSFFA